MIKLFLTSIAVTFIALTFSQCNESKEIPGIFYIPPYTYLKPNDPQVHLLEWSADEVKIEWREKNMLSFPFIKGTDYMLVHRDQAEWSRTTNWVRTNLPPLHIQDVVEIHQVPATYQKALENVYSNITVYAAFPTMKPIDTRPGIKGMKG